MNKASLTLALFLIFPVIANAQIGGRIMGQMNAYLLQYGADNVSQIKYETVSGLMHQTTAGYTDHFKIENIKKITVTGSAESYVVQFFCDEKDACINHIGPDNMGQYMSSVLYFFSQQDVANKFAQMASDIIRTDFKGTVDVTYSGTPPQQEPQTVTTPINPKKEEPEPKAKQKKVKDHLSIAAYTDDIDEGGEIDMREITVFGEKLLQIVQLADRNQLNQIKGSESKGVFQSSLKLPKAKKNYLNQYKGADCFVAEFGTTQYYEDLEDGYEELKEELEINLGSEYEGVDMANAAVYANTDDQIFHTEFYHKTDANKSSIVIRIAPDQGKNTLFLRVGKR